MNFLEISRVAEITDLVGDERHAWCIGAGAGSGVIINNSLLPPDQPISNEIDNSGGNKLNSAVKKKVVSTSVFYDTGNKEVVIPSSIKITDKQRESLNGFE